MIRKPSTKRRFTLLEHPRVLGPDVESIKAVCEVFVVRVYAVRDCVAFSPGRNIVVEIS
jgi:hypothetical protein